MNKTLLTIFFSLILLFTAKAVFAATEFISIIDPDNAAGTDYTSLSAWENAIQADLTATSTLVFSYSTASGTIPDGATVVGQQSGAIASSTHMTASTSPGTSQIMLTNISGTFQAGEQVYVQSTGASSTYVILSNSGDSVIAVAQCRSTGGTADASMVDIDGWTTSSSTYVKIWTNPNDPYGRHDGTVDGPGYFMKSSDSSPYIHNIEISEPYTVIDGIKIERTSDNWDYGNAIRLAFNPVSVSYSIIKNCLLIQLSGGDNGELIRVESDATHSYGIKIYNNILISYSDSLTKGIELKVSYANSANLQQRVYNNTIYGKYTHGGFHIDVTNTTAETYKPDIKNNYVVNLDESAPDFLFENQYTATSTNFAYNACDDTSCGTSNNNQQISLSEAAFANIAATSTLDLHITQSSALRNAGTVATTTGSFAGAQDDNWFDIDGTARGNAWDIGADEVPAEFVSTICENESAGGDCSEMDYSRLYDWEDAVETDLTATSTRVFSGNITGSLAENNVVTLYQNGTSTNITATVVATTSDQILLDNIDTSNPNASSSDLITIGSEKLLLSVASGSIWRLDASNYWTVQGATTTDDLGASPIAVAKIDGTWSNADTQGVYIDGWITDQDNYIKVYTTDLARHEGRWDTNAYRLEYTATGDYQTGLYIRDDYVRIDGLQFYRKNNGYSSVKAIRIRYIDINSDIQISNNIIKGDNEPGQGIMAEDDADTHLKIWNNIIYNVASSTDGDGIWLGHNITAYVYNNTIYNSHRGIYTNGAAPNIVLKNNIAVNNVDYDFDSDTFNSASDYNISSDSSAPGSNSKTNTTVSFVSTSTEDFHLSPTDTAAQDAGADLSSDPYLNFTTDIDGGTRYSATGTWQAAWDIGADEVNERTSQESGRWTATSTWGGFVPRPWETVTIASGTTVTFDPGNTFQDDFEENTFSGWTGHTQDSGNTAQISTTTSYNGTYSAKLVFGGTNNENYYYKDLGSNLSTIYFRAEINIISDSISNTNETNLFEFTTGTDTTRTGQIAVYDNNGTLELKAYYHNGTSLTAFASTTPISTSTWYTIEWYQKADASNGEASFWVNGRLIATSTGLANSSYPTRRIYLGQHNGTNAEALTFYADDIAIDNANRIYARPTQITSARPTALDYNISDITINQNGTLTTGNTINSDYSYYYPLWVYGDINVNGTLDQNAKSEIKLKNDTNVEHGIIVSATGKLDIHGTSKAEQDAIITAVTQDSNHNGYIYCQADSECYIRYADISYLGADESPKYGIYAYYVNNLQTNEGFWIEGSKIHDGFQGVRLYGGGHSVIKDNVLYGFANAPLLIGNSYSLVLNNIVYSSFDYCIDLGSYSEDYTLVKGNIFVTSYANKSAIRISQQDYATIYNNIAISEKYNAIVNERDSNVIKNNIIVYSAGGFSDSGTNTTIDNNLFYGNTSDGATGTNAVLSAPNFYNFDNSPGGNDNGGSPRSVLSATSNTLIVSSPSWSTNQWAGYTVWVDDDFSTATGSQFRYILSNTADTLTIAGTWSTTPDSSYEFKIIDFSVGANSPALGNGATTTPNTTSGQINIGAITDYSYSSNDAKAYNSMQLAHDNDSTGAGDTITTYAKNLLTSAINGSVTNLNNGIYYFNIDADITENDAYNGYYLYIDAGADRGKYYLIIDTASSTDTLYIFDPDQQAELNDNDEFTVVDRVYTRKGSNSSILYLTKDGTAENPITWDISGKVVLDGQKIIEQGIYLYQADYNVIDGFVIKRGKYNGIYIDYYSDYNKILNNTILDNYFEDQPWFSYEGGIGIDYDSNNSVIKNNILFNNHRFGIGICSNCDNSILVNNRSFNNHHANFEVGGGNSLVAGNIAFVGQYAWASGIVSYNSDGNKIYKNILFKNNYNGIAAHDNDVILNNVCFNSINNDGIGIDGNNTVVKNNIIVDNTDGIDDNGTNTTHDFNFFYNNGEDIDGGGAIGTSSITGYDPNFKTVDSGTVASGASTTYITISGKNWTANEYVGYGLKFSGTSCNVDGEWAGITSNTTDHLYFAPAVSAAPDTNCTAIITDFSITGTTTATTTPLGNGCRADGATEPGTVNMGAILDFSKNITDDKVFNSMQDAHDDSDLSPGDTVTTYAINEVENATIGATTTDLGPMIQFTVSDGAITEDNQYEGMYLYIEAGQNRGNYYLIVDTDASSTEPDTITILEDDTDGFHEGDVFTIVDRVYTRKGLAYWNSTWHSDALVYLNTAGTVANPITWNTSGKVILDGTFYLTCIYARDADYNVINGFVLTGASHAIYGDYWAGRADYGKFLNNIVYNIGGDAILFYQGGVSSWYIANNEFFNIGSSNYGIAIPPTENKGVIKDNIVFSCNGTGISMGEKNIIIGNKIFDIRYVNGSIFNAQGKGMNGNPNNLIVRNNVIWQADSEGIFVYTYSGAGDNNRILNNVLVKNNQGIELYDSAAENNILLNNIIVDNTTDGIDDNGTNTTHDFNFFYNNGEDIDGGGAIGTSSITGYDPNFKTVDSGTVASGASTTYITISGKNWTANEYVGYGLKFSGTSCNVDGEWAGITSNTTDHLYFAPAVSAAPDTNCTAIITDFSITGTTTATTTPLGNGCRADGATEPGTVNMGAHLGYAYNPSINNGTKYNSIQDANNDSNLAAGHTVTVYAVDEVTSGTIGSTITDLGPMVKLYLSTDTITSDNQYEGMYLYMLTGTNQYKHYLIVDTEASTTDTITILTNTATSTFSSGDTFRIIDRIYNELADPANPANPSANLKLTKSGTGLSNKITYQSNGTVIIDASISNIQYPISNYNIYDASDLAYVELNHFQLSNAATRAIAGNAPYHTEGSGYQTSYCWPTCADSATEFISIIDPDNGATTDYTSLSAWENAVQSNLATTSTMVFSYSTSTGIIPDGSTVVGETSGAIATSTHVTATTSSYHQILLANITPNNGQYFQSGEKVYIQGGSTTTNYIILFDDGNMAIAVAQCLSTGGSADTAAVNIDGWTTSSSTYIKIWTDPNDPYGRHNGKWDDGKYRLEYTTTGNYQSAVFIEEDYVIVDGLQILLNASYDLGQYALQLNNLTDNNVNIIIKNNILKGNISGVSGDGLGLYDPDAGGSIKIYNNTIYGFKTGIYNGYSPNSYIYNNTIYNCGNYGVRRGGGTAVLKNNIAQNCGSACYYGTFDSSSDYNISSDGTAPGAHSLTNTTVSFVDADNDDFHLMPTSAGVNAGCDLTRDCFVAGAPRNDIEYDIDGDTRHDVGWDIGADEAPTILYRSVGLHSGDLNTNGATVTIATSTNYVTATFSSAMPDNVGVGDVIQYGNPLTLAIISGRASSTVFYVQSATGSIPIATTSASASVYRAHLHLDDWEDQTTADVNADINTSLRDQVLVSQDLVASNTAMFVPCYASSSFDELDVDIDGWTTGTSSYIKIYTPVSASEVGESQRHNGRIGAGYKFRNAGGELGDYGFRIHADWTRVIGLVVDANNRWGIQNYAGNVKIAKNIVYNANGFNRRGIENAETASSTVWIYNNIVYNSFGSNNDAAINLSAAGTTYVYNNTVFNARRGFWRAAMLGNIVIVKNNVVASTTDDFYGDFSVLDHNASDDLDGTNAVDISPCPVESDCWKGMFVDYENGDFRIKNTHSVLYDAGVAISDVTDDILGIARPQGDAYDIGAFEYTGTRSKYRFSPGGTFKFKGKFKFR